MHKTVGIILARKGSKRLPGKNKMSLGNNKLIDIVIEKAKEAGISDIWLCTDDPELYTTKGVKLILRPDKLSGDDVASEEVIHHILSKYNVSKFKYFCLLQVTAPLFKLHRLEQALSIAQRNLRNFSGIASVTPAFKPSGNFYVIDIDLFKLNYKSHPEQGLWIPGIRLMILPWEQCIDIDYIHDLRIAQAEYFTIR